VSVCLTSGKGACLRQASFNSPRGNLIALQLAIGASSVKNIVEAIQARLGREKISAVSQRNRSQLHSSSSLGRCLNHGRG